MARVEIVDEAGPLYAQRRYVGERVKRVEDPAMLTGTARYVADLPEAGILEATFVRSAHAHARIAGIDTAGAVEATGVHAVYTARDLTAQPLVALLEVEWKHTPRFALPHEKVRYAGEPVAVVVAEDRYRAEDAAELVVVDYDPLPAVTSIDGATAESAPLLHDDVEANTYYRSTHGTGGTEAAFASAAHTFSRRFHINRHLPMPMETRGLMARYDRGTGELTVWASTQAPHTLRFVFSLALGVPENRIRVIAPYVGGAFGPKDFVFPEDICVCHAAMQLGRPVRWIEDRREHLIAASHSKEQEIELEAAVAEDGRLLALRGRFTSDSGAYAYSMPAGLIDAMMAATSLPGVYDVPEYDYEVRCVLTNKVPVAPYRGVGIASGQTAREVLLDEIARELEIDRMELRRRNMLPAGSHVTPTGMQYDEGSYPECFQKALDAIGYDEFLDRQESVRRQGRYLGVGVSPFVEMTGLGTLAGLQCGFPVPSHDNATVSIDLGGKVTVAVGTCSHGQGHATAFAQLAADALGVDVADVRVIDGDTERVPFGMGTFSSRSASFGGGAVLKAAGEVREKILRVASLLLEANADDLEIAGGVVSIKGVPQAAIPLAGLSGAAHFDPGVRQALGDPALRATAFHDSPPTFSNGCIAVIVEVDPETGSIEIERAVAVEDCGTMLNPMIVEGQVVGGLAQGIGAALLERFVYDEDGQPLSTTFMEYLVPRATEVPSVTVEHVVTPSPLTPHGVKGMAEGSSIGTPAAVLNAVMDALAPFGARVDDLPLTPQAVWDAVRRATA